LRSIARIWTIFPGGDVGDEAAGDAFGDRPLLEPEADEERACAEADRADDPPEIAVDIIELLARLRPHPALPPSVADEDQRGGEDEDDSDDAEEGQPLAEEDHGERQRDDQADLLDRPRLGGAEDAGRAIVAVAAEDEMEDARRCEPGVLAGRQAEELVIAADREAAEREERHSDDHRDRQRLQHRALEHATPQRRDIHSEGRSGQQGEERA
jgi:hypothetical protein